MEQKKKMKPEASLERDLWLYATQTRNQEATDPLRDFCIAAEDGRLRLLPGATMPANARDYLQTYIEKTQKYRNISGDASRVRFSLYQPVMNSQAGERSLYMRLRRKYRRERIPQTATIGVTGACQCGCVHCSADYHMEAPEPALATRELQQAIQESVALGVTNFILLGGEPLLRKDLESVIESVHPDLAQCVLFTNGEFLSRERCQSLYEAGLSGIFVSVDSVEARRHDSLRKRAGLFKSLCAGAQRARAVGLDVALSSYLTGERMQAGLFESMVELGSSLGAQEVTFFDAIPVGRMDQNGDLNEDQCSFLSLQDRQRIQELTRENRSRENGPSVAPQSTLTSEIGSSFCFAANTQFYLSSTGHMCPCDFTPLSIGQYPKRSIRDLWEEMTRHPLYTRRSRVCRMQDAEFRRKTILRIPEDASLPYPMQLLEAHNRPS